MTRPFSSVTITFGLTKQITDQAGKKRKGISNALGRMVRVIEDPSGQSLSTDYVFDTLGNLRKTVQGGQNRFFMYDSLGRLLYAKQPEQDTRSAFVATDEITGNTAWSVKYEYDDNGNITRTTDAKGGYIDGSYDNLNRLKVRDYSDLETPDVSFFYDGKGLGTEPARSKGKTTKVASTVSETRYTFFDELGRLKNHEQITDSQTYSTEYEYNLSGGLVSETYPSGRTVNYEINADGDLSRVWGENGSTTTTYANAFNYNVNGAVEKLRLGNGKWETAQYNNRLQITQIGLGTGSNDTSLLKLEYSYNTTGQTNNNGSLREQKITVPGAGGASGFTAAQTYTYDDLNRLQVAEEKVAGNTTWKQTFVIDRYGNREFDAANTTTLGSCTQAVCNPDISIANNRFSSGQGYAYDQNGNVTQDAEGKRFAYDAENHQTKFFAVGNSSNDPDATYHYDGQGKRVKKVTSSETTVFVYNAIGQLVAEYSTQISQTPQVSYLTTDHVGSPRVVSDQLGAVKDRKDYSAFGEETISAQRQSALGYTAAAGDELRKGYTGYEKDSESGLDFAQARYYNSTHGRYTSIDPLTASVETKDPQSFNRYSYVLNSPYKFTDPLGLLPENSTNRCNFECRVKNAIDGKGELSEADRQLAIFHIQNGTALGYTFLNASYAAIQRQQANVNRADDQYYDVSGATANEAMSNADASKANDKCDAGFAGCTDVTITKSVGRPGTSRAKKVKNGYQVTENPFSPQVNAQITVYLPKWTGYANASDSEKAAWDKMIASLKDHEEGHVDIATQEAHQTALELAKSLPKSRTFIVKNGTSAEINAAVTARYRQANKVVADGWNRWDARDDNYDVLTEHGKIPRSTVKY